MWEINLIFFSLKKKYQERKKKKQKTKNTVVLIGSSANYCQEKNIYLSFLKGFDPTSAD